MTFARLMGADGKPVFVEMANGTPLPEGAVVVDRMPSRGEDFVDGRWVSNDRAVADHAPGPRHIGEARTLKYLEALLVEAGVALKSGLLVAEAAALGIDLEALAAGVLAKRAAFVAAEVNRQLGQAGRHTEQKRSG